MKKNTKVQLLITFFKELFLRVNSITINTTTVSKYQNQHFITTSPLQQFRLKIISSLCGCGKLMEYSINLSHKTQ